MYEHHISEMVTALQIAGVVGMSDELKAKQALQEYWDDKIAITWCVDDVIDYARDDMKLRLTREEAQRALQHVLHKHDASAGVSWETFDSFISWEDLGEPIPDPDDDGSDDGDNEPQEEEPREQGD